MGCREKDFCFRKKSAFSIEKNGIPIEDYLLFLLLSLLICFDCLYSYGKGWKMLFLVHDEMC